MPSIPPPVVVITRQLSGRLNLPHAEIREESDAKPTREALLAAVRGATVVVTMYTDKVDAEFLDAAGPQLRGVCQCAVGVDNIDRPLCASRGVIVTNTPDAVTEGTADLAWALLLAAARRIPFNDRYARGPAYTTHLSMAAHIGLELSGRNLLIVGAGRIGYATALRSLGWGMRLGYVARSTQLDFEAAPLNARRLSLDEGLAWADVVSLHTPLTPDTRHLMNARTLGLMKPDAILINTARGPVVDEAALAAHLAAGKIWGAGLDVYEREPEVHPGLKTLENVVLTPHIGSASRTSRALMVKMVNANVAAILAGSPPPNRLG
jgi:lactate dehydrogenase-like 2-hydroxyacid dehydrogenase